MKKIILILLLSFCFCFSQYSDYTSSSTQVTTITGDSTLQFIYENSFVWMIPAEYTIEADTVAYYSMSKKADSLDWYPRSFAAGRTEGNRAAISTNIDGNHNWGWDFVVGAGVGCAISFTLESPVNKAFDDAYDADSTTTIFVVYNPDTHEDSWGVLYGGFNRATTTYGMGLVWRDKDQAGYTADSLELRWLENSSGVLIRKACVSGSWHYVMGSAGPTGGTIRVDGSESTTTDARDGFASYENSIAVGRSLVSSDGCELDMGLAEIIMFFGDPLTSGQITDIETYLKNKYGL